MIIVMNLMEYEQISMNEIKLIWHVAAILIFLSILIQKQGKKAYYRGVIIGLISAFISSSFCLPFILLSPKHPKSLWLLKFGGKAMAKGTGNQTDIRINGKSKQKGQGIVVMNHQSFLDVMGVAQLFEYYGECVGVARKEVKYMVPLSIIIGRPGFIFIDRNDKNVASSLANQAVSFFKKYKDGKIMIFPEGTRNDSGSFLPFKKGAFRLAIDNQVPIYPCVYSPYYFIKRNQYFNNGKIIISLLNPIDTTGMTENDTESLIEKTRHIMMNEYNKLGEELKNLGLY